MKKLINVLLALALLLNSNANSQIVQFSGAPAGQTWDDGLAAAPTGTANYPTLLNAYIPSGSPGRNKGNGRQAPWNVAGVDYRVGINTGVSLKDPATATLCTNCTRDVGAQQFSINGNTTVDGWNFDGWDVLVFAGTNVTITNNSFVRGHLTWIDETSGGSASGGIIKYNVFDQQSLSTLTCALIINQAGNFTIWYNWFKNSWHMHFQMTATNGAAVFDIKYNLFDNCGLGSSLGAHGDFIQTFGDVTGTISILFNTLIQNAPGQATQGWSIHTVDEITTLNISYNTHVIITNVNYVLLWDIHWVSGVATFQNNFADITGVTTDWYQPNTAWPGPFTATVVYGGVGNLNIKMTDGSTLLQ